MTDMRDSASSCAELIERTANSLSNDALEFLFVSVQENNINLCIHRAVSGLISSLFILIACSLLIIRIDPNSMKILPKPMGMH